MIRLIRYFREDDESGSGSEIDSNSPLHGGPSRTNPQKTSSNDVEAFRVTCQNVKSFLEGLANESQILLDASLACLIPTLGQFNSRCNGVSSRLDHETSVFQGDTSICTALGLPIQPLIDDIEQDLEDALCPNPVQS